MDPLDLRCAAEWKIGFLGASYFIGNVLGAAFLSNLGDKYGRILMIRIGFIVSNALFAIMIYFPKNLVMMQFVLFLLGMLSCIRVNMSFIYGSEIIKNTHSTVIFSFYNTFDGWTMITASLYFKYISKDWMYLYSYFFSLCLVGMTISFFMPESPRYLICIGDFKRARDSFNFIARLNGRKPLDP